MSSAALSLQALAAGEVDMNAALEAGIIPIAADGSSKEARVKSATADVDLCNAARAGYIDLLKAALTEGADTGFGHPQQHGRTALLLAVRNRHMNCLMHLLKIKADVNKPDENGVSPIMYAASLQEFEFAKLLSEHQTDINFKGGNGKTALEMADTGRKDCPDNLIILLGGTPPSKFAREQSSERPAEPAA